MLSTTYKDTHKHYTTLDAASYWKHSLLDWNVEQKFGHWIEYRNAFAICPLLRNNRLFRFSSCFWIIFWLLLLFFLFLFIFIEIWIVLSFWSNNRNELARGLFPWPAKHIFFSFCDWFIECWKYVPVNQSIDSKDYPNESVFIFLQFYSLFIFVISDSRNFVQKLCAWIWMKWLIFHFVFAKHVSFGAFELNELQPNNVMRPNSKTFQQMSADCWCNLCVFGNENWKLTAEERKRDR